MADLLDIAPSTACEVVKIDGKRFVVRGLNGNAIASIAARFPKLVMVFGGAVDSIWPQLIGQFGHAIGPIIAAGLGHLGDEEREKIASNLLLEDQLKLLTAIGGLTFPNGFGSFVEKLTGLLGTGEKPKVVKVRLRQSPSTSQRSSDAVSHPTMQ